MGRSVRCLSRGPDPRGERPGESRGGKCRTPSRDASIDPFSPTLPAFGHLFVSFSFHSHMGVDGRQMRRALARCQHRPILSFSAFRPESAGRPMRHTSRVLPASPPSRLSLFTLPGRHHKDPGVTQPPLPESRGEANAALLRVMPASTPPLIFLFSDVSAPWETSNTACFKILLLIFICKTTTQDRRHPAESATVASPALPPSRGNRVRCVGRAPWTLLTSNAECLKIIRP
ncbi:hypothetical protein FKP32DRAFT_1202489 [Trametes sanguinea]|nr:hypothetical protein FKP32DRAFT_1202489 [Trametes sanguinea]